MPPPPLAAALLRWQRAAGPYWLYVCPAPFVGPPADPAASRRAIPRARPGAAAVPEPAGAGLAADLDPARAVLFVDLPPEETLPRAAALGADGWWVVPAIQRWCPPSAVLPGRRLRALLVSVAAALPRPAGAAGAVFLLDGDRRGLGRPTGGRRFDNRYEYPACRFPPPALLRARGVEEVAWLAPAGVAPDLADYATELVAAGLAPRLRVPA